MRDLIEEEYDALDEELTKADLEIDHTKKGFFSCKPSYMVFLDEETSKLLDARAAATNQTPREVIASMLRKEIIPV